MRIPRMQGLPLCLPGSMSVCHHDRRPCAGGKSQGYFYRTGGGAEIDLLLAWPGGKLWAIEIKRSLSPTLERGFHAACADLAPARKFVVYPGRERYRLAPGIEVLSLEELAALVSAA